MLTSDDHKTCKISQGHEFQEIKPSTNQVTFSYSVNWEKSETRWASRWDMYLEVKELLFYDFRVLTNVQGSPSKTGRSWTRAKKNYWTYLDQAVRWPFCLQGGRIWAKEKGRCQYSLVFYSQFCYNYNILICYYFDYHCQNYSTWYKPGNFISLPSMFSSTLLLARPSTPSPDGLEDVVDTRRSGGLKLVF